MNRSYVKDLKDGENVLLKGWAYDIRDLNKLGFIALRDMTGIVQCVLKGKELMDKLKDLSLESSIELRGVVKGANVKAEFLRKDVEVSVDDFTVISKARRLPIQINDKEVESDLSTRLDNRFLDVRKPKIQAIFNVRSTIYRAVIDYFESENFKIINTPKITTIGLESGAESFVVNYFSKKAVLAQSPQFYKQMFVHGGFERVVEIAPVYRAEKSNTTRHLTEFTGVDFEIGFIEDENDVMDVAEGMIKAIAKKVIAERKEELSLLGIEFKVPKKIPRISMRELKIMLKEKGKELSEDDDLDAEAERMIGEYALEKFGEEFIFVTNYPFSVRPFYHMKPEGDKKGTRSFDLLFRGVEVATGAQREHRLDILQSQAKERGVKIPKIYEDVFKFGAIPHGGVGFGLDRITQRMLDLPNVREALLLPRDTTRLTP